MAVNETIVTGRKFRKCVDVANKLWQRISFWTKSSDVEFDDGKTAETKVGAINGITSDLNCEDESIAISAKAVNSSLAGVSFVIDETTGEISGYTTEIGGADTVFPFSSASGTLVINYKYQVITRYKRGNTWHNDGWTDVNGTMTIVLSNGVVSSKTNSGGTGSTAYSVSGAAADSFGGGTVSFSIVSVTWTPS